MDGSFLRPWRGGLREVKDFIVAAIETSLSGKLKQMGFSKRDAKDLLAGSGKAAR